MKLYLNGYNKVHFHRIYTLTGIVINISFRQMKTHFDSLNVPDKTDANILDKIVKKVSFDKEFLKWTDGMGTRNPETSPG